MSADARSPLTERPRASTADIVGRTCQCVLCNKTVNVTEAFSLTSFDPVCEECYRTAHPEAKR